MPQFTAIVSAAVTLAVLFSADYEPTAWRGDQDGSQQSIIEVRLAKASPAPGFTRVESMLQAEHWYVAEHNIVSDDEFERVHPIVRPDMVILDVQLSPGGAALLREATRNRVGEHLAVLVWSRLASSTVIHSPLEVENQRLQIGLDLTGALADKLIADVAARWPPEH